MALSISARRQTLQGYEMMLGHLARCGWPLGFAWQMFLAAENLMLSAALEVGRPSFAPSPDQTEDLPFLRALSGELAEEPSLDAGYLAGLDALIKGIAAILADRPATAPG
jgi:hypothetical protein